MHPFKCQKALAAAQKTDPGMGAASAAMCADDCTQAPHAVLSLHSVYIYRSVGHWEISSIVVPYMKHFTFPGTICFSIIFPNQGDVSILGVLDLLPVFNLTHLVTTFV